MIRTSARCRSCDRAGLETILDLGRTPLANAILDETQLSGAEPTYPLELVFCPDCALVQILETVPPETLFRDYVYFSSFSDTMVRHAHDLATRMVADERLGKKSLVIEAASNDGYLLQHYRDAGVSVLGIEPAENVAKVARERGILTRSDFFTSELAGDLVDKGQRADVFHAHNVLAHVPDLNGFVRGIRAVLKETGVAIIEVPYLLDLIEHVEFDTIYHEHLCYFSLIALDRLFERNGLSVCDVERLPIHGGSLRLHVRPAGKAEPTTRAEDLMRREKDSRVDRIAFYRTFAARVEAFRSNLCELLGELKAQGRRLAAYGASAKGSTLLNYCGIGSDLLDFVVDRSTAKHGRYTPGTRLPIHDPKVLLERMPDYVLLLTWNFADEILRQQAEYRRRGGRFVCPLPELKVA
jgi:SAM-dependent methyltransferase